MKGHSYLFARAVRLATRVLGPLSDRERRLLAAFLIAHLRAGHLRKNSDTMLGRRRRHEEEGIGYAPLKRRATQTGRNEWL
jgi:hypothetical protein